MPSIATKTGRPKKNGSPQSNPLIAETVAVFPPIDAAVMVLPSASRLSIVKATVPDAEPSDAAFTAASANGWGGQKKSGEIVHALMPLSGKKSPFEPLSIKLDVNTVPL